MRILYVTPIWPGFEDCLFNGAEFASGLPSFNKPLKRLIDTGNRVDFVLISTIENVKFNITATWLDTSMIKAVVYHNPTLSLSIKIRNRIALVRNITKVVEAEKYDFIYSHGTSTEVARIVAKKYKIPFAQRLYGTFLWDEITKHGALWAAIRHYPEYCAFTKKKEFLIVTNDGSKGNLVYAKYSKNKKRAPFTFLYWINGVDRQPTLGDDELKAVAKKYPKRPFLFYAARVDGWKRQDRAVHIIKLLQNRGIDMNLYYAGISDNRGLAYFNKVDSLIDEWGLRDRVEYIGNLDMKTMVAMNKMATASLSLYDVCNLTNVFHEMLASGALVIVKNDGTINDFINNEVNGFLVKSDDEVADIVEKLLEGSYDDKHIRDNAINTSKEKMKTWDERSDEEIELIRNAVKNK